MKKFVFFFNLIILMTAQNIYAGFTGYGSLNRIYSGPDYLVLELNGVPHHNPANCPDNEGLYALSPEDPNYKIHAANLMLAASIGRKVNFWIDGQCVAGRPHILTVTTIK